MVAGASDIAFTGHDARPPRMIHWCREPRVADVADGISVAEIGDTEGNRIALMRTS
jgi:hypothetical protein